MEANLGSRVLISVQRALLGEIVDCMRAFAVNWSPEHVEIRVYTNGETSEDVKDDFDAAVVTQVVADILQPEGSEPAISYSFERCDPPAPLPEWGRYVFARAPSAT